MGTGVCDVSDLSGSAGYWTAGQWHCLVQYRRPGELSSRLDEFPASQVRADTGGCPRRPRIGPTLAYAGPFLSVAIAVGLLAGPAPSAVALDEMGIGQAGNYYLASACRHIDDQDRFSQFVFGHDGFIPTAEVKRRLPELKRASRELAKTRYAFARSLQSPPGEWPAAVARLVERYGDVNSVYADIRSAQGQANNAAEWLAQNRRANRVNFGHYAAKIRSRLDLPPPGHGCG